MAEVPVTGAVEVAVVDFPGSRFNGRIAPALGSLVESGIVRVIDLAFVSRDADGTVDAFELGELGEGDDARAFLDVEGAAGGLLSVEDLAKVGQLLDPGSSAVVIVWENVWARPLVTAIEDAGGRLLLHDRIDAGSVQRALEAIEAEEPASE
ncbi:MAG TPA: DUF6325 family protein [Actinomycetes bacterium]|nr:DUF6325 family protein [Actinomycetes bacterium]